MKGYLKWAIIGAFVWAVLIPACIYLVAILANSAGDMNGLTVLPMLVLTPLILLSVPQIILTFLLLNLLTLFSFFTNLQGLPVAVGIYILASAVVGSMVGLIGRIIYILFRGGKKRPAVILCISICTVFLLLSGLLVYILRSTLNFGDTTIVPQGTLVNTSSTAQ